VAAEYERRAVLTDDSRHESLPPAHRDGVPTRGRETFIESSVRAKPLEV
jgi:hypothetical protein